MSQTVFFKTDIGRKITDTKKRLCQLNRNLKKEDLDFKPEFIIHNNLRYVKPYPYEKYMYVRPNWVGQSIYDIFCNNIFTYDKYNYYKKAIETGKILINNNIVSLNYKLNSEDLLYTKYHFHEMPIYNKKVNIITYDNRTGLLIVNKPASIAIHPTGKYKYNTLQEILLNKLNKKLSINSIINNKGLILCMRLDRIVSGLSILTFDGKQNAKFRIASDNNDINKYYIAKVKGKFPKEKIIIDKPIGSINNINKNDNDNENEYLTHKYIYGINFVNGKRSVTEFELMKYNKDSDTSIVICMPKTGRTHQIRIHLSYMGYPIINDELYGGNYMKECNIIPFDKKDKILQNMIYENIDNECNDCLMYQKYINNEFDISFDTSAQIYLHCWRYTCKHKGFIWEYETELPSWIE